MKRLILLSSFFLLFSCSGDENESSTENINSGAIINPPDWIIGDWRFKSNPNAGAQFRFKEDDYCDVYEEEEYFCYKYTFEYLISLGADVGSDPGITEIISENEYTVESKYEIGFHFIRVSEDEMIYVEESNARLVRL